MCRETRLGVERTLYCVNRSLHAILVCPICLVNSTQRRDSECLSHGTTLLNDNVLMMSELITYLLTYLLIEASLFIIPFLSHVFYLCCLIFSLYEVHVKQVLLIGLVAKQTRSETWIARMIIDTFCKFLTMSKRLTLT